MHPTVAVSFRMTWLLMQREPAGRGTGKRWVVSIRYDDDLLERRLSSYLAHIGGSS